MTTTTQALGFSSIFGILSNRRKRAADVFSFQCKIAERDGLLGPDGRSWTLAEINAQVEQEQARQRNPFGKLFAGGAKR
eukprot:CAMPEP_0172453868 /NCGR_PEP_ID=MMETSP1065-20121228/11026_1 /TAXON_ID=265537 /ORGANISM="Amphiprora paludosa, Strain CCMP125" /LENGTH=78 /DNA_ID=CAMNT_0013206103 /DNA_START=240 /DNA_END=476 /DNA_ORIENTATION=+